MTDPITREGSPFLLSPAKETTLRPRMIKDMQLKGFSARKLKRATWPQFDNWLDRLPGAIYT